MSAGKYSVRLVTLFYTLRGVASGCILMPEMECAAFSQLFSFHYIFGQKAVLAPLFFYLYIPPEVVLFYVGNSDNVSEASRQLTPPSHSPMQSVFFMAKERWFR